MEHPYYNGAIDKLLAEVDADLKIRGKDHNQRVNFNRRLRSWKLLLDNTGSKGMQIPVDV